MANSFDLRSFYINTEIKLKMQKCNGDLDKINKKTTEQRMKEKEAEEQQKKTKMEENKKTRNRTVNR